MGMGVGAAAGAVAGLGRVFGSRGKDVVIPQGTTMEMVLDRELRFTDSELSAKAVSPWGRFQTWLRAVYSAGLEPAPPYASESLQY